MSRTRRWCAALVAVIANAGVGCGNPAVSTTLQPATRAKPPPRSMRPPARATVPRPPPRRSPALRVKRTPVDPGWLFGVKQNERCGFIDRRGKLVIRHRLKLRGCLHKGFTRKGLLLLRQGPKIGWMDGTGKMVIPFAHRGGGEFASGLAPEMTLPRLRRRRRRSWRWRRWSHRRPQRKWGFINRKGKLVLPRAYRCAGPFSDGLAAVCLGRKMGYINPRGKLVIPARFKRAHPFAGGVAVVETDMGKGVIDKRGRFVFSPRGRDVTHLLHTRFVGGMNIVVTAYPRSRCGYINRLGRVAIRPQWDWLNCGQFSEGLAALRHDTRKYGYIDTRGKLVIPARFDLARRFSGGLAAVRLGPRWGFIDRRGKLVIKAVYHGAYSFRHGLAPVSVKGQWRYIDRRGRTVWKPTLLKVAGQVLALKTIARGRHANRRHKRTLQRITNRSSFRRLWRTIWRQRYRRTGPPLPKVDFRKRSLIAVLQGLMGYYSGVEITRVVDTPKELVVFVNLIRGISCGMTPAANSSPWHIVSVPRRTKPLRLLVTSVDYCSLPRRRPPPRRRR